MEPLDMLRTAMRLAGEQRIDEALALLDDAQRIAAERGELARAALIASNAGVLCSGAGRLEAAADHYEAAARFAPDDIHAQWALGDIYDQLGNRELAQEHWARFERAAAGNHAPDVRELLAQHWARMREQGADREQGDLDGAITAQLRVLELATDPADLASEGLALARLLERAGKLDDAAFACEQALAHATGKAAPTAIPLLVRYASIQRGRGQSVPEAHRGTLADALAYWGISSDASASLEAEAARAEQLLRDAQARFGALRAELARAHADPAQRAEAIQRYLDQETVEFFKQRAREL